MGRDTRPRPAMVPTGKNPFAGRIVQLKASAALDNP
jgi:hypothetical protein